MTRTQVRHFLCVDKPFSKNDLRTPDFPSCISAKASYMLYLTGLFVFGLSTQEKDLRRVFFSCVGKSKNLTCLHTKMTCLQTYLTYL